MVRDRDWRFSANLGFLWKDRPFPERIGLAAAAGFDAVEFHDEAQACDPQLLNDALARADLPVLSLNVRMGDSAGCAAIPGMADQARRDVDHAIAVADAVGAKAVHVLAGKSGGEGDYGQFLEVLRHALGNSDITILVEPISVTAMAGYFMNSLDLALHVLDDIGDSRLKILFDCYHIACTHGDVAGRFRAAASRVGHVQIASVPERAEPYPSSSLDYVELLPAMRASGYGGMFGCEYTPATTVEEGLSWRSALKDRLQSWQQA